MDKSRLLENLGIIEKAQKGMKYCKSTKEWYVGSGLFAAIGRTFRGDSRQDIISLMDEIIEDLNKSKEVTDHETKTQIATAIGSSVPGMNAIIETYRNDDNFVTLFNERYQQILEWKSWSEKKTDPISISNAFGHRRPTVGKIPSQTAVDFINSLIAQSTQPKKGEGNVHNNTSHRHDSGASTYSSQGTSSNTQG